jgi:hypothetical protein
MADEVYRLAAEFQPMTDKPIGDAPDVARLMRLCICVQIGREYPMAATQMFRKVQPLRTQGDRISK